MKFLITSIAILLASSKPIDGAFSLDETCKNKSLCFWGTNVACEKPILCPGAQVIKFSSNEKANLVDLHNKLRNDLANGRVQGFAPAVRMGAMAWDEELATMVSQNMNRCKYGRDECRNTKNYPSSGQNLAYVKGFMDGINFGTFNRANAIKETSFMINDWFSEYKDADMNVIRSFETNGKMITRFTTMSLEANTKVGCAAIWYPEDGTGRVNFGCNYATMPMLAQPVYVDGSTGLKCKNGRDAKFTGLCSVSEKH